MTPVLTVNVFENTGLMGRSSQTTLVDTVVVGEAGQGLMVASDWVWNQSYLTFRNVFGRQYLRMGPAVVRLISKEKYCIFQIAIFV